TGGGKSGKGTVFSITPSGKEQIIYAFTSSQGNQPLEGLADVNGTLYGTTARGGGDDKGTVYSVKP
ncbi:MAG TPA: choice-of-anchor tandem repeat GloVer-containing protein, partial [Candidatus Tumulicola sp.]